MKGVETIARSFEQYAEAECSRNTQEEMAREGLGSRQESPVFPIARHKSIRQKREEDKDILPGYIKHGILTPDEEYGIFCLSPLLSCWAGEAIGTIGLIAGTILTASYDTR